MLGPKNYSVEDSSSTSEVFVQRDSAFSGREFNPDNRRANDWWEIHFKKYCDVCVNPGRYSIPEQKPGEQKVLPKRLLAKSDSEKPAKPVPKPEPTSVESESNPPTPKLTKKFFSRSPAKSDPKRFFFKNSTKPIESVESKPVESESKPVDSESKPIESESKPIESESKPVEFEPKPKLSRKQSQSLTERGSKRKPSVMDQNLFNRMEDGTFMISSTTVSVQIALDTSPRMAVVKSASAQNSLTLSNSFDQNSLSRRQVVAKSGSSQSASDQNLRKSSLKSTISKFFK
jgi:hypothetical protein